MKIEIETEDHKDTGYTGYNNDENQFSFFEDNV